MAVDILASAPFCAPVLVRIGHRLSQAVDNTPDAIHYRRHSWPHERGHHFQQAMRLCKDAVQGLMPTKSPKKLSWRQLLKRTYSHNFQGECSLPRGGRERARQKGIVKVRFKGNGIGKSRSCKCVQSCKKSPPTKRVRWRAECRSAGKLCSGVNRTAESCRCS